MIRFKCSLKKLLLFLWCLVDGFLPFSEGAGQRSCFFHFCIFKKQKCGSWGLRFFFIFAHRLVWKLFPLVQRLIKYVLLSFIGIGGVDPFMILSASVLILIIMSCSKLYHAIHQAVFNKRLSLAI